VDADNPRGQAIATQGERIIYVGSDSNVSNYISKDTQVIDLKGQFLVSGFNDNHVHFDQTGRLLYGLNLLDVSGETEFVARIRAVGGRYPVGSWITGGDWSAYETWAAGEVAEAGAEINPDDPYGNLFLPNKQMIDRFTQDRPVLVNRFDRKVYLANSKALEIAGIVKGSTDPVGIAVLRDRNGESSGALFNPVEGAVESTVLIQDNVRAFFSELVPEPSREQRNQETLRAWEQMRRVGVTSYSDVTSEPVQVDIYKELRQKGLMTSRVRYRPPLDQWDSMSALGIRVGFGDEWIRFGAVKAWIDGIMGNSSARFYEPYTHNPSSRGIWLPIITVPQIVLFGYALNIFVAA
jgi:predicted amidohydrolase YtcJ